MQHHCFFKNIPSFVGHWPLKELTLYCKVYMVQTKTRKSPATNHFLKHAIEKRNSFKNFSLYHCLIIIIAFLYDKQVLVDRRATRTWNSSFHKRSFFEQKSILKSEAFGFQSKLNVCFITYLKLETIHLKYQLIVYLKLTAKNLIINVLSFSFLNL